MTLYLDAICPSCVRHADGSLTCVGWATPHCGQRSTNTSTVGPLTPTPFSDLPQPGSPTEPDPNGEAP